MNMSAKGKTSVDWLAHVMAWRRSRLSQVAYARLHGVRAKSLSHWVGQFKTHADAALGTAAPPKSPKALTLVAVQVQPGVATDCSALAQGCIKLHHPSGWVMEWPAQSGPSLLEWARGL
jgi:transposase-like protein